MDNDKWKLKAYIRAGDLATLHDLMWWASERGYVIDRDKDNHLAFNVYKFEAKSSTVKK